MYRVRNWLRKEGKIKSGLYPFRSTMNLLVHDIKVIEGENGSVHCHFQSKKAMDGGVQRYCQSSDQFYYEGTDLSRLFFRNNMSRD